MSTLFFVYTLTFAIWKLHMSDGLFLILFYYDCSSVCHLLRWHFFRCRLSLW